MSEPAATPEEERALKLWVVLSRAYQAIAAAVEADITSQGLSATEFGILEALHHKGPLLQGELQRKLLITSGGITYLVDRLVARGLVERLECPTDRRARYAALTEAGRELIAEIFPRHRVAIASALAGLDSADQARAIVLLRQLGLAAAGVPAGD